MKSTTKWQRSQGTYVVNAKTLEQAKNRLGNTDWGQFKPIAGEVKPTKTVDGKITEVVMTVGHSIKMPIWSGYKNSAKECKAEWDRMFKALTVHEREHGLVYMESIVDFQNVLSKLDSVNLAQLQKLVTKAMADMEKSQTEFENVTDHGRKRGVFLDPPGTCK